MNIYIYIKIRDIVLIPASHFQKKKKKSKFDFLNYLEMYCDGFNIFVGEMVSF